MTVLADPVPQGTYDYTLMHIIRRLRLLGEAVDALGTGGGTVSDTAYDATSWNGVTTIAPSKNAVRDKIESLPAPSSVISDTVYGAGWNGDTTVAPSKNAVYDKLELIAADYVPDTGDTTIAGVKTFSSDPLIPDEAYGSGWNGVLEPPTKNAVYDKIEAMIATPADPSGWTTIIKSANQDVTNAGVTNDNQCSFSVTANAHYMVEMVLTVSGNDTTGDYTCQFAVDAGTMRGKGTVTAWTTGEPPNAILFTMRANAAANTGTAVLPQSPVANIDDIGGISLTYSFMPSNTTTFRFKFGNGTPGIGRTSRTWKGSIMRYKTLD